MEVQTSAEATVRQSIRGKRKASSQPKDDEPSQRRRHTEVLVDFAKLEMASLLRYKKFFCLQVSPTASKKELLAAVKKHFAHHPRLRDAEVISDFLYRNKKAQERSLKPLH